MSNIVANRNASTDKDEEEGLPAIASKLSWTEDKWRKKVCELIDFKVCQCHSEKNCSITFLSIFSICAVPGV